MHLLKVGRLLDFYHSYLLPVFSSFLITDFLYLFLAKYILYNYTFIIQLVFNYIYSNTSIAFIVDLFYSKISSNFFPLSKSQGFLLNICYNSIYRYLDINIILIIFLIIKISKTIIYININNK